MNVFFTMIYKEGEDLVALNFENSVTCNLFHGGVVCAKFAHTTFEVLPRLIKSPYKIDNFFKNALHFVDEKICPISIFFFNNNHD